MRDTKKMGGEHRDLEADFSALTYCTISIIERKSGILQFSLLEPAWWVAQLAHAVDEGRKTLVRHTQCVLKFLTK